MDVDIIEFRVPGESNKALFVWDLQPSFSEAFIYECLFSWFLSFGPLYLVKVCPNAPSAPPGFYALVKFYSARHALAAQQHTDGRVLFQNTPVKVRLSNRQTPSHLLDNKPLGHARCLELANHWLGFNGWSTQIITLKELASDSPEEVEEEEEELGWRKLRYGCMMKLSFPQHGVSTRGVAVVEESFTLADPAACVQKHSKLRRWVRDKALIHAFSSVLLLLLGDGRVMVEVRQDGDQLLPEEEPEGVIKVNNVSWSQFEHEDNEEWELTVS